MANVLVYTENISHQEWLEYRNLGIGGSDASVVCGINKWKSPIELYMEKLGMLPPSEAGEAAYWGNRLEDLVKEEFTLRTGIEVVPVNAILQHEDYPFMLANLDGVCEHPEYGTVVFEAKTAGQYMASEWGDDKIPDVYMLQLQHYMCVTGLKGAYIAVLIGGNDFRWQFVHRDDELISMLIELESEFWDRVQSNIPPELDGSDASAKFIKEHFPDSVPESIVTLPDEAEYLVEQYNYAVHEIDRFTESKQDAENKLKQMLGDNEVGIVVGVGSLVGPDGSLVGVDISSVGSDGSLVSPSYDVDGSLVGSFSYDNSHKTIVTWKSFTQERLDTKAIKSDHPSLCERYTNTKTCRRFSVKSANNDYMSNQENGDDLL